MTPSSAMRTKNTDIVWIGEIPVHWNLMMLKRVCQIKRGASPRPIDDPKYFDDDGEFGWVRIADVSASKVYLEETTQRLSNVGQSLSVQLHPGELFLSIAGTVGKPCITKIKCCIHDGFVYFPGLQADPKYLFYIFDAGQVYLGLGKLGTQLNLNTDTVGEMRLPIPPLAEQLAIAAFLDRKTAEIDAVIAKKERLVALLQEERQALISRAVTRGLDAGVEMKDSGVEWLGEVPTHWVVKRLKYSVCFLNYRRIPLSSEQRADLEKVYPYYGASGIIDHVDSFIFDEDLILIGEDGANLLSRSTPLAFIATGRYWVNNHAHILKPISGCLPFWVERLNSIAFDPFVSGSAQPKLTIENLANIDFASPDADEQRRISASIAEVNARTSAPINTITDQITKLREYRQALISAAVTGKIPVPREVAT